MPSPAPINLNQHHGGLDPSTGCLPQAGVLEIDSLQLNDSPVNSAEEDVADEGSDVSVAASLPLHSPPVKSEIPTTCAYHPLGSMFSPPLDEAGVIAVVSNVLHQEDVATSPEQVLRAIRVGRVDTKMMSWLVRRLMSAKATEQLKARGLKYVGPCSSLGSPQYCSGEGITHLLNTVSFPN